MNTRPTLTLAQIVPPAVPATANANPPLPKPILAPRSAPAALPRRPYVKGPAPFFLEAAAGFQREVPDIPLPPVLAHCVAKPDQVKPVAIGLRQEVKAWAKDHGATVSQQRALTNLLACLCRSLAYRRALAADGSQRHDLEGKPTGLVSDEHRLLAQAEMKAHHAAKSKPKPKSKRG